MFKCLHDRGIYLRKKHKGFRNKHLLLSTFLDMSLFWGTKRDSDS